MSAESPAGRPTGSAVVPAILAAAAKLFAEHGPANTTLRAVAARADVTYGLLFRHFGAKTRLVGAVLDHLGQQLVELIDSNAAADTLESMVELHTKVVARAVLDGYPADKLQTHFPANEILIAELNETHSNETSSRLVAANSIALQLGWRLFEPYLIAATRLQDVPQDRIREAIELAQRKITAPDAAGET